MHCVPRMTSLLALAGMSCSLTSGFVVPTGFGRCEAHGACYRQGAAALAMAAESRPTSRGEAIAAAAAGLLTTVAGVSAAGAATPEALPACPVDSNCVSSTSFKLVQQGRYMEPWFYADDSPDAPAAFAKLLSVVENDPQLKLVEKDPEGLYIVAQAKSAVPPDGFDKIEFLFKPSDGLVSFRSKSMKDAYAGPVLVGDGNSNRNRLISLRKKLGWPEQGIDNYMRAQGIDSGTTRAKGYLSELGWRQGEVQSYGEEDDF